MHEKDALDAFLSLGPKHTNMRLKEVGLILKKDLPYIGASPDAMDTCDCCGTFVVECKCPYCIKNERVLDAWNQTDFLKMDRGNVCMNKAHKCKGKLSYSNAQRGILLCKHK